MNIEYLYYRLSKKNAPAYSVSIHRKDGKIMGGKGYVCSTWNMFKDIIRMMRNKDVKEIKITKF